MLDGMKMYATTSQISNRKHLESSYESANQIKSSPDEKIMNISVSKMPPKNLFKKTRSEIRNYSTKLPNEVLPHTRSVDLQDILLKLSHSSDFHFIKSEDFAARYTPNLRSEYQGDFPEKEFLIPKNTVASLFDPEMLKPSYLSMIWPYRFEICVCLLSYVSLLLYSLIKGGKGFKR
jgi:hypothetical protein